VHPSAKIQTMSVHGSSGAARKHANELPHLLKRRTDVVRIFPNNAPIVRLIGAFFLEQNDEWQLQHRCLQLEGLQSVSDYDLHCTSAVAK